MHIVGELSVCSFPTHFPDVFVTQYMTLRQARSTYKGDSRREGFLRMENLDEPAP